MSLYIGNSKVTGVQRVNGIPVWGDIEGNLSDQEDLQEALNEKQDTLVSGTNIKTINGEDILGEGDIEVQGGGASFVIGQTVQSTISLTDAGLHLLDGSLIYHGAYSDFIDYMANYYNDAPEYSNVSIVGSLTDNNGVLSGFSTTSYARLPIDFDVSDGSAWEAVYKVTTGSDVTTSQYFVGSLLSGKSHDPFIIGIYNNSLSAYINYDLTTTSTEIASSITPQSNTEYTIKLEFTGSAYNLYIDGVLEATVSSSTPVWTSNVILGVQSASSGLAGNWLGSIDLNNSYMNINGSRWWTGRQPFGFTDESIWQDNVFKYGTCDKYVYDSVNQTVRIPKRTTEHGLLIKTINNADNWARIYQDGWCEQGGQLRGSSTASDGGELFNLPIAYLDTKYTLNATMHYSSAPGNASCTWVRLNRKTSSSFYYNTGYTSGSTTAYSNYYFDWYTCGYIDISDFQFSPRYEYLVIATVTKTSIQIDIDEVMTDINEVITDLSNKANKDLSNVSWNSVSASDIPTDVKLLSGSGTLILEDNKLYKLTSSGSTTFSLPTITDTTKFHQIMVQLKMSSVVTINVGTSYYFNSKAPDLSKAGSYDLVWEYDNINGHWVFGATSKGTA